VRIDQFEWRLYGAAGPSLAADRNHFGNERGRSFEEGGCEHNGNGQLRIYGRRFIVGERWRKCWLCSDIDPAAEFEPESGDLLVRVGCGLFERGVRSHCGERFRRDRDLHGAHHGAVAKLGDTHGHSGGGAAESSLYTDTNRLANERDCDCRAAKCDARAWQSANFHGSGAKLL
jgi:hypothetical protein